MKIVYYGISKSCHSQCLHVLNIFDLLLRVAPFFLRNVLFLFVLRFSLFIHLIAKVLYNFSPLSFSDSKVDHLHNFYHFPKNQFYGSLLNYL